MGIDQIKDKVVDELKKDSDNDGTPDIVEKAEDVMDDVKDKITGILGKKDK